MKKIILLFTMVASVMLFNITDVAAADYTISGFSAGEIEAFVRENATGGALDYTTTPGVYVLTLTAEDTLKIGTDAFVGATEDYYLQMGENTTMRVALDANTNAITVYIDSGVASTTNDEDYIFYTRKSISYGTNLDPEYWYDDVTYPMNFVVAENATFNIRCPFIVTSTTLDGTGTDLDPNEQSNPASVTNEGTINVTSKMEVEAGAEGNLTGKFTLADGAQIVAATDITAHIANADVIYDASTGTYATPADYTEVNAAIAEAEALTKEDYTEESWATLQTAIAAVVDNKTSLEQATVDGYAASIKNAIQALEENNTVGVIDPGESEGNLGESGETEEPTEEEVTPQEPAEEESTPADTTEEEVPEVPQTFDAASLYITIGLISIAAITGAVIYLKRKNA